MSNVAGHRAVRVRVHLTADGSSQFEGFGIDNFAILPSI